jgi:hypothetical protein
MDLDGVFSVDLWSAGPTIGSYSVKERPMCPWMMCSNVEAEALEGGNAPGSASIRADAYGRF